MLVTDATFRRDSNVTEKPNSCYILNVKDLAPTVRSSPAPVVLAAQRAIAVVIPTGRPTHSLVLDARRAIQSSHGAICAQRRSPRFISAMQDVAVPLGPQDLGGDEDRVQQFCRRHDAGRHTGLPTVHPPGEVSHARCHRCGQPQAQVTNTPGRPDSRRAPGSRRYASSDHRSRRSHGRDLRVAVRCDLGASRWRRSQ